MRSTNKFENGLQAAVHLAFRNEMCPSALSPRSWTCSSAARRWKLHKSHCGEENTEASALWKVKRMPFVVIKHKLWVLWSLWCCLDNWHLYRWYMPTSVDLRGCFFLLNGVIEFLLTQFEGLRSEGVTTVQIAKPSEANKVLWFWATNKFDLIWKYYLFLLKVEFTPLKSLMHLEKQKKHIHVFSVLIFYQETMLTCCSRPLAKTWLLVVSSKPIHRTRQRQLHFASCFYTRPLYSALGCCFGHPWSWQAVVQPSAIGDIAPGGFNES